MNLRGKRVLLHDMCLRDGMHPKRHQISLKQMVSVASALDATYQAPALMARAPSASCP